MNISNAQRARLGIFAAAGGAVLVILLSITLGFKLNERTKTYWAFFKGESVSGLEQGAEVKFTGVPIGRVEKISYDASDLSKVKVAFRVQADFPMKADMYATTGLLGITGLKYIEIMGGTNAAPTLRGNAEIATRSSLISSISGKAEAIAAKVELLVNNLNILTNPDSLRSFRIMLDNIAAVTSDAHVLVSSLTPKVDSMTSSAVTVMSKVDQIAGNVQGITATLNRAFSAGQLSATISSIDSAALSLKLVSQNLSLIVLQSHEDFAVSMRNLRDATENADQLTQMLVENPSLLLRNEAPKERSMR
jgi:phospholipid/cholesterol/gamma-HCH transport system substrate-binding protein